VIDNHLMDGSTSKALVNTPMHSLTLFLFRARQTESTYLCFLKVGTKGHRLGDKKCFR